MIGHVSVVEVGSYFDYVAADQPHTGQAANQGESLAGGQAARYRGARARGKRGIHGVDIEGQIHRPGGDFSSDVSHDRRYAALGNEICRYDLGAVRLAERAILGLAPGASDADLIEMSLGDKIFFQSVTERGAVVIGLAPNLGAAGVEVGVYVNHSHRAVVRSHRAQRG